MATRSEMLKYVENTAGNATLQNFIEDWEPVGNLGWEDLSNAGLVCLIDGRIKLTFAGQEVLHGT